MDPEGHRLPVANAATVQRLTRMSAEEHEARLRYDAETVFQLQLNAWSDRTWAPVAEALAEYGYAVMVGWLYTGRVYGEVSAIGKPVPPCPSSWLDDHTIQSLANEVVARAIRKFKAVLMDNAWKSDRGASLATYFVGQCKIQFPNVYRSWHAEEKRRRELGVLYDTERVSREDPEAVAVGRGSAASILDQMPPLVADVFRLKYLEGYSYAEISDMVPGVPNAKAAENMVTRERAKWRNARQAG